MSEFVTRFITKLVLGAIHSSPDDSDEMLEEALVEDATTGSRTCRYCGTTGISDDVCGTRRVIGGGGGAAGGDASGTEGTDAFVPIAWRVVDVNVTKSSFDRERSGGWGEFYDDPRFSSGIITFAKQRSNMTEAERVQYIEDASVVGDEIFPEGDAGRMFEELRVNVVVLAGMCSYFLDRLSWHIERIRDGTADMQSKIFIAMPEHADCVSIRLYVWLIYTGGVFPPKIPTDFVWNLFVSNEKVFHNKWIREICEKVLSQYVDKDTVYQRLKESVLYSMSIVYDACLAYIRENYTIEHKTVAFTAYTNERPFKDIVCSDDLPAELRFESCRLRIQAMSHYHRPVSSDDGNTREREAHDQCVRIVDYIPWGQVPSKLLRTTLDDKTFRTRCNLNEFWKACAAELATRNGAEGESQGSK